MIEIEIRGIEEMDRVFSEIAPRHAVNISRAMIHGIAGEIRDEAKRRAPKVDGTLKKAIKAKRRRTRFDWIQSDVIVEHGASAKNDAFYWRFVEYGTSALPERPFVLTSVRALQTALPEILREQFVTKLTAALERQRRRAAK
ncbi:HK97-gp10 family putative phage morphogenesis protein [Roseovarius sp. C03]|uniref:HK97-gp10 family putative phage morphogenesis protein n=1 Tax=Roseovarius sp. C03 TaxID=3449222 RepID=UPI003EDBAF56